MIPDISSLRDRITAVLPQARLVVCRNPGPSGQHSLLVANDDLVAVARVLRDDLGYDFLSNLTGVDWPDPALAAAVAVPDDAAAIPDTGFLEVVYHLYSLAEKSGPLVLRARSANRTTATDIPSVTPVFRSAEFQEREILDLFGVVFSGHPDPRRILMWDEFEDHPMRKDYVPPMDHEYEPTPHDAILALVQRQQAGKEDA